MTKPTFTEALKDAQERYKASPIWKKLEGTPWENDAPVIAAELMLKAYKAGFADAVDEAQRIAESGLNFNCASLIGQLK